MNARYVLATTRVDRRRNYMVCRLYLETSNQIDSVGTFDLCQFVIVLIFQSATYDVTLMFHSEVKLVYLSPFRHQKGLAWLFLVRVYWR